MRSTQSHHTLSYQKAVTAKVLPTVLQAPNCLKRLRSFWHLLLPNEHQY